MCKYVSIAPADCIGAFTWPSTGVHEQTKCHTCAEARRPGRSECGQSVNNTEIGFTRESCRKCFPPALELREEESGVATGNGDGTVSGSAISRGTVVGGGNGASHSDAINKDPRTVNGNITGNMNGYVGNKSAPTLKSNAAGAINSTGKAPTVPSMAWIKERAKELMKVREAAMTRETAMTKGPVKPGPLEGPGNKGGMAKEAVMTMGPVKPGSVEGSGNKGTMTTETAMSKGTVKPGSIEGFGNQDAAMRGSHQ